LSADSNDVFCRQEANLKRLKDAGNFDVFGAKVTKLPCDNMSTFQISDCVKCPRPCKLPEDLPFGENEE
jgi:hypothetical protein